MWDRTMLPGNMYLKIGPTKTIVFDYKSCIEVLKYEFQLVRRHDKSRGYFLDFFKILRYFHSH